MDFLVRNARPQDAEAVVAILNPIIEAGCYTAFDAPFTVEAERSYIENLPPRGIFHVAVDRVHQAVVGFQSLEPFAAYTQAFDHVGVVGTYVDLNWRRRGIGSVLFETMWETASKKGYEKIFTFVRADNPAALAAYLKQGFSVVGTARRHARVNGVYIDEVMIERFLH